MDSKEKKKSAGSKLVSASDRVTGRIRGFISNTIAELGRCTWPGRAELMESTLLVIVVIAILAVYVAGVDKIAQHLISFVTTGKF